MAAPGHQDPSRFRFTQTRRPYLSPSLFLLNRKVSRQTDPQNLQPHPKSTSITETHAPAVVLFGLSEPE